MNNLDIAYIMNALRYILGTHIIWSSSVCSLSNYSSQVLPSTDSLKEDYNNSLTAALEDGRYIFFSYIVSFVIIGKFYITILYTKKVYMRMYEVRYLYIGTLLRSPQPEDLVGEVCSVVK